MSVGRYCTQFQKCSCFTIFNINDLFAFVKSSFSAVEKHLQSEIAHSTLLLKLSLINSAVTENLKIELPSSLLCAPGRSPKEIVDFLKLPKTTIYRVKKQFDEADSNKEGIATRKKHSRRSDRVRGEEFVKNVKEKIDGNPGKSMRAIAKEMDVGSMTIVRTIHEDLGLKSYALRKGQLLTENMENNRKGKAAALLNNLKHDSFGMLRFFSDEKNFDVDQKVNPRNDRWICKDPSEIPVVMHTKFPASVMVLGVISSEGDVMPPHFFEKGLRMNADTYINVLETVVKPWMDMVAAGRKYVFQQDSAPAHKAKKTQSWLTLNVPSHWGPDIWPPNSPDCNPLDYYVWGVVERDVNKAPHTTIQSVKKAVHTVMTQMDKVIVAKACASFRTRLETVHSPMTPQREQLFLNGILDLKLAEFPLKLILVKDAQNFKGLMKMCKKITDLIKENPQTTLLELEQDTGISKTTIGRIVTEDLKLKKTPAKFIPRFLTNEQNLCRLATCEDMMEMTRTDPEWKDKIITGDETWVYGYDPENQTSICRVERLGNKALLVAFSDNKGIVHHEYLPAGQTVIKEMYLGILRHLREAIRKKRPEKWTNGGWILHHDNARPHTAHLMTSFLAKNGTQILLQPPYLPDIAPNDFFLFPKLKAVLKGRHFDTRDDIIEKSPLALKSIPKEAYKNCFDNWEKRWRWCVEARGDYFEKF
ncbi:hypothetical protein LAZ67_15000036 [Cordylochernes scorpioides]|uniref:Transposase n=1 Tax=Cordylochernes scorpioides TaxID=51811 RepID=A0ABY6LB87_9ARAC|nr:hypothetical protein LAZ67_15000036 [Cordylochernes scorpioides]